MDESGTLFTGDKTCHFPVLAQLGLSKGAAKVCPDASAPRQSVTGAIK